MATYAEMKAKYKTEITGIDVEWKGHKNPDRQPPVDKVVEHDCSPIFELPCPIHSRERVNRQLPDLGALYDKETNKNYAEQIRESEAQRGFIEVKDPKLVKRIWGRTEKTNHIGLGVSFYFVWAYSILTDLLLTKKDSRKELMEIKLDFINQIDEGDQLLIVRNAQKCGSSERKKHDPMWGERNNPSEKHYNFFSNRRVMSKYGDLHVGTDSGQVYEYLKLGSIKTTKTPSGSRCSVKMDPEIYHLSIAAIKRISEVTIGYEWDGLKLVSAGKKGATVTKKSDKKATKKSQSRIIEEPEV